MPFKGFAVGEHRVSLYTFTSCVLTNFTINLPALGYLYSSVSLNSLTPNNARAVLAAGCLLGGMDDLCAYAYQACKDSITVETIKEWIDFVNSLPSPTDGTTSPSELPSTSIFGPYESQLRNDVFHFLVVTLPTILDIHQVQSPSQNAANSGQGRETLLQIFSRVPFDLFKNAIESPTFQIGKYFSFSLCIPECPLTNIVTALLRAPPQELIKNDSDSRRQL